MRRRINSRGKAYSSIHILQTHAPDIETACDIIALYQARAKKTASQVKKSPSLRAQFALDKERSKLLKRHGKISLPVVHFGKDYIEE